MRRVALYLFLGIIFSVLSFYLIQELSPFDTQKLEEIVEIQNIIDRGLVFSYLSENAYIIGGSILASIFFIFISIHLFIDKLFFKNFYENASSFDAIRRGFLLILAIVFLIFSKLSKAENYVLILIVLLPFLLEFVYVFYFKKENFENTEELPEEVEENRIDGKHISYEETISELDRFNYKKDLGEESESIDKNTSDL